MWSAWTLCSLGLGSQIIARSQECCSSSFKDLLVIFRLEFLCNSGEVHQSRTASCVSLTTFTIVLSLQFSCVWKHQLHESRKMCLSLCRLWKKATKSLAKLLRYNIWYTLHIYSYIFMHIPGCSLPSTSWFTCQVGHHPFFLAELDQTASGKTRRCWTRGPVEWDFWKSIRQRLTR